MNRDEGSGATHAIDSVLYGPGYSTKAMRLVFDETNVQRQRLRVEAALAEAQAERGMIPAEAAAEIVATCLGDSVQLARIGEILAGTQNDIVALTRAAGEQMGPLGREYIHYGATSQDIHITGQALLLKDATALIADALLDLETVLLAMAEKYRGTPMAGRTHGQHAIPITFGYKVASWLYAAHRQRLTLSQLRDELLLGSLKGAVGTHAVWGEPGIELERDALERLGLKPSIINIQASEERYAEYLTWCAMTAGLLARICAEVRGMHRTEVGEVREAFDTGSQVGSSTMPHKRNAEWSEAIQGTAYKVRANALVMLTVVQEHERDGTRNPAEHLTLAESSLLLHKMLTTVATGLGELEVDTDRMRANLDLTGGLIAAEAVTFELARRSGMKEHAHGAVYDAAMMAFERGEHFSGVLAEQDFVAEHMSAAEIDATIAAAVEETGTSAQQVDLVLGLVERARKASR